MKPNDLIVKIPGKKSRNKTLKKFNSMTFEVTYKLYKIHPIRIEVVVFTFLKMNKEKHRNISNLVISKNRINIMKIRYNWFQ